MVSEIGENPCREDSRKLLQLIPTILWEPEGMEATASLRLDSLFMQCSYAPGAEPEAWFMEIFYIFF
jgi:hypothetical protein